MTELMKAKLPNMLWRDFIVFGKRFDGQSLEKVGVVYKSVKPNEVVSASVSLAKEHRNKTKYPGTLRRIKEILYHEVLSALDLEVDVFISNPSFIPMGFEVIPQGQDKALGTKVEKEAPLVEGGTSKSGGRLRPSVISKDETVVTATVSMDTQRKRPKCVTM